MQSSLPFDSPQFVDYLLVIEPPLEIQRFVNKLKKEVVEEFGSSEARNSKPHITIFKYLTTAEKEAKIIRDIKDSLSEIRSFSLRITGFGSFKGSNTLHLETTFPDSLKEIQKILQEKKREHRISNKGYGIITAPQITIAKNLIKPVFNELKSRYSKKSYEGSFHVDRITVLKAYASDSKYSMYTKISLR